MDRPYVRTARWTWVHLVGDRDERQRSFRGGLRGLRFGLPEALRQALSLRKLLHRVLQLVSRRASKSSGNVIAAGSIRTTPIWSEVPREARSAVKPGAADRARADG